MRCTRSNLRSNLIACGLTAMLSLSIAACSKQDSAAESSAVQSEMAADRSADATGGAMPASAPMPQEARAKASAEEDSVADFEAQISDAAVQTDTRVAPAQVSSSANAYDDGQRKFVRTANAQFRVKDVYDSALAIEDVAAKEGGFVVANDISAQTFNVRRRPAGDGRLIELAEYTVRGTLTVRVPSENTQTFLRAIAKQMEFLDQRSFAAADVQFQMLRQQLAYQREQQAQQDLGQIAAGGGRIDMKADVISARTGAKLQRDEALIQQKEFEDKVAFSTISLSLYQLSKIRQTEMIDAEAVFQKHSPGFFTRLLDALRVGWYGLLDLLLALLHVWPLWLFVLAVVIGVRRWMVSRRRGRATPPPLAE